MLRRLQPHILAALAGQLSNHATLYRANRQALKFYPGRTEEDLAGLSPAHSFGLWEEINVAQLKSKQVEGARPIHRSRYLLRLQQWSSVREPAWT